MAKIKNSVWGIFSEGVRLYFKNFGKFFKYLAFPVFGQMVGVILMLLASFLYVENLPKLLALGGFFDNFSSIFFILILLILPGFFLFTKAFWDYLVAYGAINSMAEAMTKTGKLYDFSAHTEMITRRTAGFVGLWLLFGLFTIVGMFPLFWVIAMILFVYFVLIFQVFTFEPDKSPIGCFKKSLTIIKGNFWKTFGLMTLLWLFTYVLLPELIKSLLDLANVLTFLAIPVDGWARQFPIDEVNKFLITTPTAYQLTSLWIAKATVEGFLGYCLLCFTLPLRSICWTLWYKSLNKGEAKLDKRILDRAEG